jgi:subtilisin family serine protease
MYCLPGSVVVKMALGEAPEAIPAAADVRPGRLTARNAWTAGWWIASSTISPTPCASPRVRAAANVAQPGYRHLQFDESEQVFGLARTFRIDVPSGAPIGAMVDSLSQVTTIEAASPNYVCMTPFEKAMPTAPASDWAPWEMIRAPEALAYTPGDPSVIVALVDTGVAPSHPELAGRLRSGFDTVQLGKSDLAFGLQLLGDSARPDTNPTDEFVGHGMGCAGIIGALGMECRREPEVKFCRCGHLGRRGSQARCRPWASAPSATSMRR